MVRSSWRTAATRSPSALRINDTLLSRITSAHLSWLRTAWPITFPPSTQSWYMRSASTTVTTLSSRTRVILPNLASSDVTNPTAHNAQVAQQTQTQCVSSPRGVQEPTRTQHTHRGRQHRWFRPPDSRCPVHRQQLPGAPPARFSTQQLVLTRPVCSTNNRS